MILEWWLVFWVIVMIFIDLLVILGIFSENSLCIRLGCVCDSVISGLWVFWVILIM